MGRAGGHTPSPLYVYIHIHFEGETDVNLIAPQL